MMHKVWKRISEKRPRGAKLIKIVGILSALVWIAAGSAFILLKGKSAGTHADNPGHGGAGTASAHGSPGHGADVGDHGVSLASVSGEQTHGNPDAAPGHGGGVALHGADPDIGAHVAPHNSTQEARGGSSAPSTHSSPSDPAAHSSHEDAQDSPHEIGAAGLPSQEELSALRQVVDLLYQAGALDKAVSPLRKVMRAPTREIPLLTMATEIFLGTAQYEEALGTAEKVLALQPDDKRVRVQIVEAQYRLGRLDIARAGAMATLKTHPGDLDMLTTLATMEVERGPGHPEYGISLKAALKLKPDHVPALYLQGRMAQLEGDFKDAETAFRKVVKQDPSHAKAFGQLGMALYHLGKEEEAEKAYQAELKLNPADYNTWYNLGELRLSHAFREWTPEIIQRLNAEAMQCFLKTLALNPDHAEAHFRVGVLLNGNGQFKEAIRHLEAALKTDSRHVPTLVQLSVAFENLKQPERARAYLNKAYELDPLNKVVLFKLKQWS